MGDPCGSFPSSPEGLSVTSGISTPFEVLFRTRGLITYVLRTRAPLTAPKDCPFDLHVLGPPQTFALSQDQTLQFDACVCHSGAVAPVTGMADLAIDRVPQALAFAVRAAAEGCLASRERFSWLPLPRTSFQGASARRRGARGTRFGAALLTRGCGLYLPPGAKSSVGAEKCCSSRSAAQGL